nr:XkdW family protein [Bacillus licheniformis]
MQVFLYDDDFYYKRPEIIVDPGSMPENSTAVKPKDGLWRAKFIPSLNDWVEGADQEYINGLKKDQFVEKNPVSERLSALGRQLADEKLARKQAEIANKALGEHLVSLKLELLNIKGGKEIET